MGLVVDIFFFGIAFLTLAISGGFVVNSSIRITHISDYRDIAKLESAHRKLTIASVIAWITVAFILVAGILYLIFGSEETEVTSEATGVSFGSIVVYGLLFISLVATSTVGILSAMAASDINASGVQDKDLANRQAIIAAVLAIVVVVALLVVIIARFFHKPKKKNGDSEITRLEAELGGNGPGLEGELAGEGGETEWFLQELKDDPELAEAVLA